jgi:hypothetical protein
MPLTHLDCGDTCVSTLAPLKNLKLVGLAIDGTQVSDLTPLKNMKLTELSWTRTPVSDLTPLLAMPLKTLRFDVPPGRDTKILRSLTTLQQINGQSAADFWKEVDTAASKKRQ